MRSVLPLLIAGFALSVANSRADDPPKAAPGKPLDFTGRAAASASVEIRPRASGYLTKIAVKEGATVKKGDLLVEIDSRPYLADLDMARAKVAQAEAEAKVASTTLAGTKGLAASKVVGRDEITLAEAKLAKAEAGVAVAKAEMERSALALSWTKLTAPIDGRLGRIYLSEGALVSPDAGGPITVITRTDPIHVWFDVDERTVLALRRIGATDGERLGVAIALADENGFPHSGKLDFIESNVDSKTGAARFRATLPNPKGILFPGIFVRVRLTPSAGK